MRITMNAVPTVATIAPPAPVQAPSSPPSAESVTKSSKGTPVVAPMAGTFYRAPSPEASPYVEVGSTVGAGDVLCIIESMKMMHEIRAAVGGTVESILVDNGTPIGTGEALFLLS